MRALLHFTVGAIALQLAHAATGAGSDDRDSFAGDRRIDMLVVAEPADPRVNLALPSPEQPAFYLAYDAGYIEAGDPVAGEKPPSALAIDRTLRSVLKAQNFLPATSDSPPSLLLIYHWGIIRPDSHAIPNLPKIDPNLHARLALVVPSGTAGAIENFLQARKNAPTNPHFPAPSILSFHLEERLQMARDARYFVVVSAYDYAALGRRETNLWWRIKLSAFDTSSAMYKALPALIRGGQAYFGCALNNEESVAGPLFAVDQDRMGKGEGSKSLPPPELAGEIDTAFVRALVKREHDEFAGERVSAPRGIPRAAAASGGQSAEVSVPPALATRIADYRRDKDVLLSALTARISKRVPGTDTREVIDAFNRENAARIATLDNEREIIRNEIARLATAGANAAAGKSLNALLEEFALGVRQTDS